MMQLTKGWSPGLKPISAFLKACLARDLLAVTSAILTSCYSVNVQETLHGVSGISGGHL